MKSGEVDARTVYRLSSGEQEANVAGGVLAENGVGVDMRGVSGLRLLEGGEGRRFSVPVVGSETELGGITFGGGRFAGLGAERLAARGDWVYDEVVFKMRRAMERSARGFKLYDAEERERGLEMIAEALELVNTLEGFLPHSYGFGLAPYKVWLNFFSLLYGNSVRMDLEGAMMSAMESLPMKGWDDIMMRSIVGGFIGYVSSKKCKERARSKFAKAGYVPRTMALNISKMEAAYLILLHEQEDYTDVMRVQGFTDDVMEYLRDYAGREVMSKGFAW